MAKKKVSYFVISYDPNSFKKKWNVRQWTVKGNEITPCRHIHRFLDLESARKMIPKDKIRTTAFPGDDPSIQEIWI